MCISSSHLSWHPERLVIADVMSLPSLFQTHSAPVKWEVPRPPSVMAEAGRYAWRSMQDQAPASFCRDIKGKARIDLMVCRNICVFCDFL